MADELLYEMSKTEIVDTSSPFIKRELVYVIDQNNGSYTNNQIIMDCASISNAGKYADFSDAWIAVPLLITMTSTYNFSAVACDFSVGLKSGFHQLVHSINVEYNSTSVVQTTALTNMYISYKLNTTLCVDDLVTLGAQIGFRGIDSPQSWYYSGNVDTTLTGVLTSNGNGSTNNANAFATLNLTNSYAGTESNNPFLLRQLDLLFNNSQDPFGVLLAGGTTWQTVSNQFARGYTTSVVSSGGYYGKAWNILATLRLKDLSDFFAKLPLVRGAYMKIYVNLNQSLTTINITAGNGVYCQNNGIIIYGGLTNPLMFASGFTNNGSSNLLNGVAKTMVCSVSVLNSLDNNCPTSIAKTQLLSSCRLYCPLYTINPMREEEYLANRVRVVKYRDIFQSQALNQSGSFNYLVQNGLAGLKHIIVCPMIASTVNGIVVGTVATSSFSPIRSPFASEPASCSPVQWISNYNVQISGVNIFADNENYGFIQFLQELYGVNSINGGLTDGLSSGLISQTAYYNNYGYLVADVGRRLPEEDKTAKSVQISGTILSKNAVDLFIFCELEKSITIDIYSGKRLD